MMKTSDLVFTLVLLFLQKGSKATGNVTSCLQCHSPMPEFLDYECENGTAKGEDCSGEAVGCYSKRSTKTMGQVTVETWKRGCCLSSSNCTEIHEGGEDIGRTDQTWCDTSNCNTGDPRNNGTSTAAPTTPTTPTTHLNHTSCLQCHSPMPDYLDYECENGTATGEECGGEVVGCYSKRYTKTYQGLVTVTTWIRGCCLSRSQCTDIHEGEQAIGRTDQTWCDTSNCNTGDPRPPAFLRNSTSPTTPTTPTTPSSSPSSRTGNPTLTILITTVTVIVSTFF